MLQLISQEANPGVHYEYYLPLHGPRSSQGFSWSHTSWGDCSVECGGGEAPTARDGVGHSPLLKAMLPGRWASWQEISMHGVTLGEPGMWGTPQRTIGSGGQAWN